jgi:hypothetical protein
MARLGRGCKFWVKLWRDPTLKGALRRGGHNSWMLGRAESLTQPTSS